MNNWIEVEKQLPVINDFVLGYYSKEYVDKDPHWTWEEDISRFIVCKLNEDYEWCDDENKNDIIEPSHWMPLPKSPED